MDSQSQPTWHQIKQTANQGLYRTTGSYLSDVEEKVLHSAWEGYSYEQIAEQHNFTVNYIRGDVGPQLWRKLSTALGEKVSKTNFREPLTRGLAKLSQPLSSGKIEYPNGPVSLRSQFYVERPPIETDCYQTILQPGSLIRIKAPRKMGKTSLLDRIIEYAETQEYRTFRLNLRQIEQAKFSDLDKFLRCFCACISDKLNPAAVLSDYWNEDRGSMLSCTRYLEMLLAQSESPLVLALDEVDRVFQYPNIATHFFPLIRSWHEEANNLELWEQLRLVVVHSTEDYGSLDINQSPFNVGLPVPLAEWTSQQVEDLAQRHSLDWNLQIGSEGLVPLLAKVGGHPFLVRLALYKLATEQITLDELLQDAATDAGIYSQHLRHHLATLKEHPELANALEKVVNATEPVPLDTMQAYKLHSMGLIEQQGNQVTPRCQLYRQYFREHLN